jgi:hypothetical protein
MNETIAAFKSCGEAGAVSLEREGLVIHLPVLDERSQRAALERRRAEHGYLGTGRDEVNDHVRADEATGPGHGDPVRR